MEYDLSPGNKGYESGSELYVVQLRFISGPRSGVGDRLKLLLPRLLELNTVGRLGPTYFQLI